MYHLRFIYLIVISNNVLDTYQVEHVHYDTVHRYVQI